MKKLLFILMLIALPTQAYLLETPEYLQEVLANAGYSISQVQVNKAFDKAIQESAFSNSKSSVKTQFRAMLLLNTPYKILTCLKVLQGKAKNGNTFLLLLDPQNPEKIQHAVILLGVSIGRNPDVTVGWESNKISTFKGKVLLEKQRNILVVSVEQNPIKPKVIKPTKKREYFSSKVKRYIATFVRKLTGRK